MSINNKKRLLSIPNIEKCICFGTKGKPDYLWTAEIIYGIPLIAVGDEKSIVSALVFEKNKDIYYCAFDTGVAHLGTDIARYCPNLSIVKFDDWK